MANVLNQLPQAKSSFMDKLAGGLGGLGAGLSGNSEKWNARQNEQNKDLSQERKLAMAQDAFTLYNRVNGGDVSGARRLLMERIGHIETLGGDPKESQIALQMLDSGDPNMISTLTRNLGEDVQTFASQGLLKLPTPVKRETPIKAYNTETKKPVFATPKQIADSSGVIIPPPESAKNTPTSKPVLDKTTNQMVLATDEMINSSNGRYVPKPDAALNKPATTKVVYDKTKMQNVLATDQQIADAPDNFGEKVNVPDKAMKAAEIKARTTLATMKSSYDTYVKIYKEVGTEYFGGESKAKLKSAYTSLLLQMKEMENLGVLSGPDLDLMTAMIADPTSLDANLFYGAQLGGLLGDSDPILTQLETVIAPKITTMEETLSQLYPGSNQKRPPLSSFEVK